MMDVYEFSERDEQSYLQSKTGKQKKRKSKDISTIKTVSTTKKTKRNKLSNNKEEVNNELHPPIRLKLIRDQSDPQIFKSIQIINDVTQSSDFSFDFNEQSLLHCKLSDGREFALNDIVWAKISGYPFWPSKILSINLSSANQKFVKNSASQNCVPRVDLVADYIACVEWLAYDQISYVNCTNLTHFHLDFSNKFSGKIKNKKYFEAVNEAKTLCEENTRRFYESMGTHNQTVDSVQSCDTIEADTSSTLPSHNFTSPESNQSVQSYCPRPPGARCGPLSNQSDRSLHSVADFPACTSDSQTAHQSNICTSSTIMSANWELPDLGSNLDFESNNHIPEFSDYEDDCDNIDIAKIEFLIDATYKANS